MGGRRVGPWRGSRRSGDRAWRIAAATDTRRGVCASGDQGGSRVSPWRGAFLLGRAQSLREAFGPCARLGSPPLAALAEPRSASPVAPLSGDRARRIAAATDARRRVARATIKEVA